MSHILNYDGQYFRIDIAEVSSSDDPDKGGFYVSWCSNAFKELKDMPSQASSRIIPGPPLPKFADARRYAFDWIKTNWDSQQHSRRAPVARDKVGVTYTVSLFKGDINLRVDFEEFSDAKAFAKTAEKSFEITKVGITNNESPQYLTVWERAT